MVWGKSVEAAGPARAAAQRRNEHGVGGAVRTRGGEPGAREPMRLRETQGPGFTGLPRSSWQRIWIIPESDGKTLEGFWAGSEDVLDS